MEQGPHTVIHVFVGNPANTFREDMGNFYSAGRDPIFYAHHANVDRCWSIWDAIPGNRKELYEDADFLDSSFVFYDENARLVQVYVKDGIDAEAQLGITYEDLAESSRYRGTVPKPLGGVTGVVPRGKNALRRLVSKAGGQAQQTLRTSGTLTGVVQRPTGKADFAKSKGIAESQVEEVLILEDVTVPGDSVSSLSIFINLPDANTSTKLDCAEHVGSVSNLPHASRRNMGMTQDVRVSISDAIANLGIDSQTSLVVSIVATALDAKAKPVTIGGFKIEYL
jgi:polyphenol oxidase